MSVRVVAVVSVRYLWILPEEDDCHVMAGGVSIFLDLRTIDTQKCCRVNADVTARARVASVHLDNVAAKCHYQTTFIGGREVVE